MYVNVTTTGLRPLIVGSTETFQAQAYDNDIPWDLTGGNATLYLADCSGVLTTIAATIVGGGAQANWTVAGHTGRWARAWRVEDANGVVQICDPISFVVQTSPTFTPPPSSCQP